jgi:hypothetical protein
LIACRELVPEVDAIAGYLVDELDALLRLVPPVETASPGKRARATSPAKPTKARARATKATAG